jgi:hypothetical protein
MVKNSWKPMEAGEWDLSKVDKKALLESKATFVLVR